MDDAEIPGRRSGPGQADARSADGPRAARAAAGGARSPAGGPRADLAWTAEFARRYEAWRPEALPLIEAHEYAQAFRTYPWPAFEASPWTPVDPAGAPPRLGVVTTAGLYRPGAEPPFADTAEGDPRVVFLPADVEAADLDVAHSHIPAEMVRRDPDIVLPLRALRALVREGALAGVGPRIASVVGYQTRADDVARVMAPAIARAFAEDGVTLALLVPV
jgi:hypothetical protein